MYMNHVLLSSYAVSGALFVSNALQLIKALVIVPYQSQEYITQSKSSLFFLCLQKKKQQKKKTQLKFTVDCTHPVEDGIMDVANFVSNVFFFKYMYTTVRKNFHILMSDMVAFSSPESSFSLTSSWKTRALGAMISGMRHRCRLRETGWAEFCYFLCFFKTVAPRTLDSCHRPEESKALGTRMSLTLMRRPFLYSWYWAGSSQQLKLLWRVFSTANTIKTKSDSK